MKRILAQNSVWAIFLLNFFLGGFLMQAQPAHAVAKILIYGDSLAAGFGLKAHEGFAPQLQRALDARQIRVKIYNASQSGETSAGGLARLSWALESLPKPDLAIVELGANDALRALAPAKPRMHLDEIIKILRARGIKVLLAGMLAPPNLGKQYGAAFNRIYPDLAKRHDILLYPFFLEGVAGRRDLNLADGKHPNAKGIKRIVAGILPFVIKALRTKSKQGE